jgi:hypothetical protein
MSSDEPGEKRQEGPFRAVYLTPNGEQIVSDWVTDPDELTRWYAELDRQHRPPPARPLLTDITWTGSGDRLEATFETWDIDNRFACSGRLAVRDGRLLVTQLTLRSASAVMDASEPGLARVEGITGATLRKIPLGRVVTEARRSLLFGSQQPDEDEPAELRRLRQDMAAAADRAAASQEQTRAGLRRGRPGYPDSFYRDIALEYIDHVTKHGPRGVIKALGTKRHAEPPTVRAWLRKARAKGFLASTSRGKADASPGPRLYEATTDEEGQ